MFEMKNLYNFNINNHLNKDLTMIGIIKIDIFNLRLRKLVRIFARLNHSK